MDTIRRVLKSTKQTDNPRMLVRVEAVEKMLKDYDELRAMMVAFRHAANSIGKSTGVITSHVDHEEAAQSVCGDHLYIEMISEAEERFKLQAVENDQLKARVERLHRILKDCAPQLQNKDELYGLKWAICDVLNETPAQSLAEHDAALLEQFGRKVICTTAKVDGDTLSAVKDFAYEEAAQIRQEALSNG
jgi:hypothetical protein